MDPRVLQFIVDHGHTLSKYVLDDPDSNPNEEYLGYSLDEMLYRLLAVTDCDEVLDGNYPKFKRDEKVINITKTTATMIDGWYQISMNPKCFRMRSMTVLIENGAARVFSMDSMVEKHIYYTTMPVPELIKCCLGCLKDGSDQRKTYYTRVTGLDATIVEIGDDCVPSITIGKHTVAREITFDHIREQITIATDGMSEEHRARDDMVATRDFLMEKIQQYSLKTDE